MLGCEAECDAVASSSAEPQDDTEVKHADEAGYDVDDDDDDDQFVEVDPTDRYGRSAEVLVRGATKTVFRAFDKVDGIEVAWNQVWLKDVREKSEELKHIHSEVRLLKKLKHKNIIKIYTSWFDHKKGIMNFITELFCSGTLREFRRKHRHVDLNAVKKWAKQILRGLLYLHTQKPPIIHRDLKCDNIFVNGNSGEIKIGDLGFAMILKKSGAPLSVNGTPEFMAPELYQEDYNELVDVYSFGMCVLEMITLEFPYSECRNVAQIYKRVTAGIRPLALQKVKDPQVRQFIESCIAPACQRHSARELLKDPFLQCERKSELGGRQRMIGREVESFQNGQSVNVGASFVNLKGTPSQPAGLTLSGSSATERGTGVSRDVRVKGNLQDERTIGLRFRIAESRCGGPYFRNIQCLFDLKIDTPWSVAKEMVRELNFADQDLAYLANVIGAEITTLVPDWIMNQASPGQNSAEGCESELWQESHDLSSEEVQGMHHVGGSQTWCIIQPNMGLHGPVPNLLRALA